MTEAFRKEFLKQLDIVSGELLEFILDKTLGQSEDPPEDKPALSWSEFFKQKGDNDAENDDL